MFDPVKDLADFHQKFGLDYDDPPRQLPMEIKEFRIRFLQEELVEYIAASHDQDLARQLDALVDLVYVALGTSYLHGFDFKEAWMRVHQANMRKVRAIKATDSTRNSTYDVVKPPGWKAPDLSDLVA